MYDKSLFILIESNLLPALTLTLHLSRVNSFVLLTAKFEDLKKIAKNFLDDAIFKQLAEFIYKLNENKVVDIFDDVDLKEKQTKRGSELVKDKSDSDVSLSSENMKYMPSNLKNKVKTRFESKSRHIKPNDTKETENIKKIINNKYVKDGLTIDNIESEDSSIDTEKSKKTKTKGRTISDGTFRISTVTSAKPRNEFDQYDNFKYKNQWTDFLRSRYIH